MFARGAGVESRVHHTVVPVTVLLTLSLVHGSDRDVSQAEVLESARDAGIPSTARLPLSSEGTPTGVPGQSRFIFAQLPFGGGANDSDESGESGESGSNGAGGWRGGSESTVSEHWGDRPDYCRQTEEWKTKRKSDDPEPVFIKHKWDRQIMCGEGVEGIDGYYREGSDSWGGGLESGDMREAFGGALLEGDIGAKRRTLYRADLVYECFAGTEWDDPAKNYPVYAFCRDLTRDVPSKSEVKSALEHFFPGRSFEQQNFLYRYEQGKKSRPKVVEKFAEVEEKYPALKKIFWKTGSEARKKYEQLRKKYADAYRTLDPITERLLEDPKSTPPEDCAEKVEAIRDRLAKEIEPSTRAEVDRLLGKHPLGYQVTEALAYCYSHTSDHQARASRALRALRDHTRRVNLAENIFFARANALYRMRRRAKKSSSKSWEEMMPSEIRFDMRSNTLDDPMKKFTEQTPRFPIDKMIDRVGTEGTKKAAVISNIEEVDDGAKLTFEEFEETTTYKNLDCEKTNRIARIEQSPDGDLVPKYEKECEVTGKGKKTIEYRARPVFVGEDDAAALEEGMEVSVLVAFADSKRFEEKSASIQDTALWHAWWPDKGKKKGAVVYRGIPLRK